LLRQQRKTEIGKTLNELKKITHIFEEIMEMEKIISIIASSIETKKLLAENTTTLSEISNISKEITRAFKNENRVYFCGNGGSAADAQHLAAEFSGRFYIDRKALPAEALHCNTSYLTAVGNDYGYENVYSRIIQGIGKKGDVLIGISTSGNSENIVKALECAKLIGVTTISLTGANDSKMKAMSNYTIQAPSTDTPRIQECHILIGHIICQLVEENLFINP
jgi:D-sedoheptulose 7-phosphate isomerase